MDRDNNKIEDPIQRAIANRLSALQSTPVDVGKLRRNVMRQINESPAPRPAIRDFIAEMIWIWRRSIRFGAVTASVLIVGLVLFLVHDGARSASAADLSQIYAEVASGSSHATQVHSIDEANSVLKHGGTDAMKLPNVSVPVRSCCEHMAGGKPLCCASLNVDNSVVVLAVGQAADQSASHWTQVTVGDRTYHVHQTGGLTMVCCQNQGTWFCVMGQQSQDKMLAVASGIRN